MILGDGMIFDKYGGIGIPTDQGLSVEQRKPFLAKLEEVMILIVNSRGDTTEDGWCWAVCLENWKTFSTIKIERKLLLHISYLNSVI